MTTASALPSTAGPAPATARTELLSAARRLAAITLVGLVCGAVVVGVLGRLAMALIAGLNPEAAGLTSDDGFEIGRFTLVGSLQLVGSGLQFGVLGVFGYVAARGLMVGPGWFRLLSISVGPGVVVGALLVGTEGVDFTRLHPVELSVALFLALPTVFVVALLHLGAQRLLTRADALPRPLLVLGLLPWVPALPLTLLLAAGWWTVRALRRTARTGAIATVAWVLRAALAVVFVLAVADVAADLAILT